MICFLKSPVRVTYSERDRIHLKRCAAWTVLLLRQCGMEAHLEADPQVEWPAEVRLGSISGLPDETREDWLHIRDENGNIMMMSGSEIAYSAALDYLARAWKQNRDVNVDGSISDVSGGRNSDAFRTERSGEWRGLFGNVLFDDLQIKPNSERNRLCVNLLTQYAPDFIAMQECGPYLREPCGQDDIAVLMARSGYEETVPHVVRNPDRTNYTPIFYRKDRLRVLESAYHHYRHQAPGISADDRSSKGMTWAVVEHGNRGGRLILINTHFCTQSDVPRLLQAKEMMHICQELRRRYPNVPVLLGGDFNTVLASMTYRWCIEQGFEDCIFISENQSPRYCAHHPYPQFDREFGMMVPNGDVGGSFEQSVDHILYLGENARIRVYRYGMITNRLARSYSDHCPIWVDFCIEAALSHN